MNIEEGNKLIAEFYCERRPICPSLYYIPGVEYSGFNLKDARFHSSWNWLMPVVEKIMNHRYPDYYGTRGKTEDDGDFDDCAHFRTFGMRDKDGFYMVRINACGLFHGQTLMEATYDAVLDFIENLNQQPKQNQ